MADTWITDTGASTRFPVYTRANASDVLPGPVSPLGATLSWIPGLMEGWRDGNIRQGAFSVEELAGDPNPTCAIFNGYFYVNASVVRVYGERAGAGAAAIDAAFFGNRPDTPPYVPHPDDQSEAAAARIGSTMAWVMSATEWPEMDESKRRADAARAGRPDLASASDEELVARAREMTQLEREFFSDHVLSSSNTAVGPTIVGQIAPTQLLRLLGSAGDVDSALPSYELWSLSREVRESPELTAAFEAGVAGLLERLRAEDDGDAVALLDHLDRFLEDYGARGPNEWDAYSDVWESQPELVLALVDRMRLAGDDQSPLGRHDAVAEDRDAATAEVLAGLGDDEATKGLLLAGQASALRFMGWRERTKTNCVKAVHEQRMALRELGRRATERGVLDHPKQVFMLLAEERDDFVAAPAALRDRCREREAAWRLLWDREPPYFVEGDKGVPPLSSLLGKGDGAVTAAASGDVLTGGPGCAGVVQGTARVILDPSDPTALEPGDILIAPNTDPAWTPLFVPAGGVVVDVGALNSHAVIVSRELGIPCVVSVVDATKRIPDGALIEIDGGAGTVKIL
ncbi:MAG TPA: PEP-utilizing enzyme [Acidimicrobiales bacterium]